jgi:hypothetical protein
MHSISVFRVYIYVYKCVCIYIYVNRIYFLIKVFNFKTKHKGMNKKNKKEDRIPSKKKKDHGINSQLIIKKINIFVLNTGSTIIQD